MTDSGTSQSVFKSSPGQLAAVLEFGTAGPEPWTDTDLPGMFSHQLAAPIAFDLKTFAASDNALAEAAKKGIRKFEDLLRHSQPPEAVLRLAKDFFKAVAGPGDSRLAGQQVAYVLYLAIILTARERLSRPFTRLTHAELLRGVEWGIGRTWINEETRALFQRARDGLATRPSSGVK